MRMIMPLAPVGGRPLTMLLLLRSSGALQRSTIMRTSGQGSRGGGLHTQGVAGFWKPAKWPAWQELRELPPRSTGAVAGGGKLTEVVGVQGRPSELKPQAWCIQSVLPASSKSSNITPLPLADGGVPRVRNLMSST